uniref:Heat shock 70 kDa protein 12B n=1 Tax=Magallana gigas TaxID=29159 RepID=A0A8W8IQ67_MAGGI
MMPYDKDGKLAGISKESLLICLEPEATAAYCKWSQIEKDNDALSFMKPGRSFLLLEDGGGTIDIAVQKVREDGKIQEINRVQVGYLKEIYMDEEFKNMMEDIVSKPICEALFRLFEKSKRVTQTGKVGRDHIQLTLLEIADNIVKCIADQGMKNEVELKRIKHRVQKFFYKVVDEIVVKIQDMLVSDTAEGIKFIIMEGRFLECEFLQRRIRDSFPIWTVVIPQGCGLAILKGAVLFGHDPDIIAARV